MTIDEDPDATPSPKSILADVVVAVVFTAIVVSVVWGGIWWVVYLIRRHA